MPRSPGPQTGRSSEALELCTSAFFPLTLTIALLTLALFVLILAVVRKWPSMREVRLGCFAWLPLSALYYATMLFMQTHLCQSIEDLDVTLWAVGWVFMLVLPCCLPIVWLSCRTLWRSRRGGNGGGGSEYSCVLQAIHFLARMGNGAGARRARRRQPAGPDLEQGPLQSPARELSQREGGGGSGSGVEGPVPAAPSPLIVSASKAPPDDQGGGYASASYETDIDSSSSSAESHSGVGGEEEEEEGDEIDDVDGEGFVSDLHGAAYRVGNAARTGADRAFPPLSRPEGPTFFEIMLRFFSFLQPPNDFKDR